MKQKNVFNSILSTFKQFHIGSCLTICQFVILAALAASFLAACNPSTTNHNTYNGTNAGMSGGGATKDPGDGTGGSTGDGGGGQGILCKKTKDQNLNDQLFVRDIYEAIYNHNRKLKNVLNDSVDNATVRSESIAILTKSIKQFYGPASRNLEFTDEKFWTQFIEKISFIGDDKKLYPSQDANSPIALPEGCQLIQIAYWDEAGGSDEEGTLYVNQKLWAKLDQLNKIGLLAHEYFFKLARKANYKNSDMIRFKVGQLLSEGGIAPLFNNWYPSSNELIADSLPENSHGFKYCQGTSEEDPSASLQFYQYQGLDGHQRLTIPLLRSNSINTNPFQTSNFTLKILEDYDLAKATDLLLYQTYASDYGKNIVHGVTGNAWTNAWFNNDDLLWSQWSEDKTQRFISFLIALSRKKEVLWAGHLPNSTNPIKIELINPVYNKKLNVIDVLKTKEDLILTIHAKIENALKDCAGPLYSIDSDTKVAVTIINKEISDSMAAGIYPKNFPVWNSLISRIILNYSKKNSFACNLLNNSDIKIRLPELLYKLTIPSYSEEDVKWTLGLDAYKGENSDAVPFGKIRVSQGNSTINFDLKCQDYTGVFSEIMNKNANTSKNTTLVPNKTVLVTKEIEFSAKRQFDDRSVDASGTLLREKYMTHINTRKAQLPAEILKIQEVSDFLKFDKNDPQKLFERFYLNQRLRCQEENPIFGATCKQFEYFIADLKKETELNLSPCEFVYDNSSSLLDETCMIVGMASSSKKYRVSFDKGFSSKPVIDYYNFEFVRQIPK